MVILKNRLHEMEIGHYALVPNAETGVIETKVICISGLASRAWFSYLDHLEQQKEITANHKARLINCSHNGMPKDMVVFTDETIGLDSIDIVEMKGFIAALGLSYLFENDETLTDMINTLDGLGYYFQRLTKNNI